MQRLAVWNKIRSGCSGPNYDSARHRHLATLNPRSEESGVRSERELD
jgi:hypothetical protein